MKKKESSKFQFRGCKMSCLVVMAASLQRFLYKQFIRLERRDLQYLRLRTHHQYKYQKWYMVSLAACERKIVKYKIFMCLTSTLVFLPEVLYAVLCREYKLNKLSLVYFPVLTCTPLSSSTILLL